MAGFHKREDANGNRLLFRPFVFGPAAARFGYFKALTRNDKNE